MRIHDSNIKLIINSYNHNEIHKFLYTDSYNALNLIIQELFTVVTEHVGIRRRHVFRVE